MSKTCSVEGCDKKHQAKGYCPKHLYRVKKYGSTDLPAKDDSPVTEQRCSSCGIVKPLSEFHKQANRKIGVSCRCKECAIKISKEWHDNNKERFNANARKNYRKNGAEARRKRVVIVMRYQKKNPEKVRYWNRLYKKKNPNKLRDYNNRRRDRKLNNGSFVVTDKDLRGLYSSPCANCGSTEKITADHIIPLSRGGRHSIGNLQPLCSTCNGSKATSFMVEWKVRLRKSLVAA